TGLPFLVWYLLSRRPDVLLCSNLRLTRLALLAARFAASKVRIYVNLHNTYSILYAGDPNRDNKVAKLHKYFSRCAGIIAVSRGVAADFVELTGVPSELVQHIPNPVITPAVYELSDQPVAHPWLRNKTLPVILAAGRLREQKNFPLLLTAFAALQTSQKCRLIILGDGPQRSQLETLITTLRIQDCVSLVGQVANPYNYMKQANLFVLSSNFEGLGNVLVEALALGTPVVSTDCRNGPSEILQDGQYGTLVPVGDAGALTEAMHNNLDVGVKRQAYAAVQRYTATASADAYLQAMRLSI
ncbi:MAG: glycosyltransferase, partial [Gammaproteobacteria bacterium]|nr:glycosyltransferase [Gammaproteobacteria bacterium]